MTEDRLPESSIETSQTPAHAIIIRKGGAILGHAFLFEVPIWQNGSYTGRKNGCVEEVWMHKDYREEGYGQEMMEKLIEHARLLDIEKLNLTSREHREAARHIYKKLGFDISSDGFTLQLKEKKEEKSE